jgi:hypothetical protein
VADTFTREYNGELVAITVAGEVIEATGGHPFWVVEGRWLDSRPRGEHVPEEESTWRVPGRWVDARDLQAGDVLLLRDERRAPITQVVIRTARVKVFNFRVEELQCYAVGERQVLVHNNSAAQPGGNIVPRVGDLNAPRPIIETNLPPEVTEALPQGQGRPGKLLQRARNFASRYIEEARAWWEARNLGMNWPENPEKPGTPQWAEHPRALVDGGDPPVHRAGGGTQSGHTTCCERGQQSFWQNAPSPRQSAARKATEGRAAQAEETTREATEKSPGPAV